MEGEEGEEDVSFCLFLGFFWNEEVFLGLMRIFFICSEFYLNLSLKY